MRRLCAAVFAAAVIASAPSFAQQESGPNGHPQPIVQGQSTTPIAPPGGIDQAGVATPNAAGPATATQPLQPGPPAGPDRAATLSNADLITAGVAITALVVCAIACLSNSSATTTSTTATHH
ncbi:MAG: hypothetical protein ACREHF_13160 [Rhizomicrobium sp.]